MQILPPLLLVLSVGSWLAWTPSLDRGRVEVVALFDFRVWQPIVDLGMG